MPKRDNYCPDQRQFSRFQSQQGWTFWSLMFTLAVLMFFAYVGMKLVPIYSTNENIKNAMEVALREGDLRTVSRSAILRKMSAQLYLDGTDHVLDYKKEVKVKRSRQKLVLTADYERRVPLFFNLGIYVDFLNTVEKPL